MSTAKHHSCYEPGECDVGRGRDAPAVVDLAEHLWRRAAVDEPREGEVHTYRAYDTSDGADERVDRLARWVERPAREYRLCDLLRGDAEEEEHEDVVDQEMEREVVSEDTKHGLDFRTIFAGVVWTDRVVVRVVYFGVRIVFARVSIVVRGAVAFDAADPAVAGFGVCADDVEGAPLDERVVLLLVYVCEQHRGNDANDERHREFLYEVQEPRLA